MFGSRLQEQITANSLALTTAITELKAHVIVCDKRAEQADKRSEFLYKKIEAFDSDLAENAKDRQKAIEGLEAKFDKKHSENRKFLYTIVGGIAISLIAKILDYVQWVPTTGLHH